MSRLPQFRGVVDALGRVVELRRYAQSTSGRTVSQGTAPSDSRSRLIASPSPTLNSGQTDIILRRYDNVVPQRSANSSLADTSGSDAKYSLSASMHPSLPDSKIWSILDGKLLPGNGRYHGRMDSEEVRRTNFFRILREKFSDSPKQFEIDTGYSANMVSQLRNRTKDFGEKVARKIETMAGWERGILDKVNAETPTPQPPSLDQWPSLNAANRSHFEKLNAKTRRELDEAFARMINGAYATEVLAAKPKEPSRSRRRKETSKPSTGRQRHGTNQS